MLQAAGLLDLWAKGYVEPIQPPPEPYHILAQQVMALVLQEHGIGRNQWLDWVRGVPAFSHMPKGKIEEVVAWMLEHELLWDEQGILGIGRRGEERFGRRHFLELMAVFLTPPLFTVLYGRQELGFVDEQTFLAKQNGPRVLLLGGRAWHVTHIDWSRKQAYVEATDDKGRSRWKGSGKGLSFRLCQAIQGVLAGDETRDCWSQRARDQILTIRQEFPWLEAKGSVIVASGSDGPQWWTFAGSAVNASLAAALSVATQSEVTGNSLSLSFENRITLKEAESGINIIRSREIAQLLPAVEEAALNGLKFSECLPKELALHMLQVRMVDEAGLGKILSSPVRLVRT